MADDAAAPEGELSESTAVDTSSAIEGTTESPEIDTEAPSDSNESAPTGSTSPGVGSGSGFKVATIIGLVAVLVAAGLTGWFGYRAWQDRQAQHQRAEYLQVGRQAAINLTTIDYQQADADVQRILESATDSFYDDFAKRSQPFVEVVKQAQSKSTGEVTSAGIESIDDGAAKVLVAVTVKTSNLGAAEQPPRAWRMRVTVKQTDDQVKVSNVEFVP